MKLLPTEDERVLAETLCEILTAARAAPDSARALLADAGMLALTADERHGGSAGALTNLGVFFLEAGKALCPLAIHATVLAALAVDTLGDEAQRAVWLPRLAAGTTSATTGLWDPDDAHVTTPRLRATADGAGRWRLDGRLDYVLDGDGAQVLVVTAVDESSGCTVGFVVDVATAGVRIEPVPLMGEQHAATVDFTDVAVDGDAVLDGVTDDRLRWLANTATALLSLDLVGVAQTALDRTVAHTTMRHQFGRPIASFQGAQHMVANMHVAVAAARLAARSAVFWLGRGQLAARETAIARMHAATAAKFVTLDAHQLHGGIGYVVDTDLHRYSERARFLSTLGGGADVAATWLIEEIL